MRPHAWWTPMGLLAVIGPSRKDQRGLPRFLARNFSKICRSSHQRRVARSRAGKSTWVSTLSKGMSDLVPANKVTSFYEAGADEAAWSGRSVKTGEARLR